MEKLKIFIRGKAFLFIALVIGCISLLFIGQEKQYGLFAWLAPLFLLQFSRRAKTAQFILLFTFLVMVGIITQRTHNLFNDPFFAFINGLAFALVNSLIYFIDRILYTKEGKFLQTFIFPSVYVVIEVLTTSVLGSSGVLAQSQFSFTPLAQLSSLTGLHGITFIICWLAAIVFWLSENDFNPVKIKSSMITFGTVFILIIGYGFVQMNTQPEAQQKVNVATVSGPFDLLRLAEREKETLLQLGKMPDMKIPSSFFSNEDDINTQLKNTRKAAEVGAKIIVWNEAALFINQQQLPNLLAEVKEISRSFNVYILMAFFEENNSKAPKPINNKSVLIHKNGTTAWEYKKAHPTPAELPLVNAGDSQLPYLNTEYGKLSNVICYDYDFPTLIKEANKNKVDIMLVPSYDWQGFAPMHAKMAQFASLQNGHSLIRANGSDGINMVVNQQGKLVAKQFTSENSERILYADLPVGSSPTIYAKIGNILVLLCFGFLLFSVYVKIQFYRKRTKTVYSIGTRKTTN
ncbi:nitrilase-related carbon-nitrogen hydrolase [Draconibacterium sediminis]|uniref:CN hydrolase domain-containing protein n=1 Tax=Draconibacterium sediminis TaxID=1544798 RepID=A0A0D8J8G7_9BACT|nr:nitrilase-related carbon-nitrogen hydrolase [Draconibacterium sediminis]KJF42093.1 hypothetical protein LH29_22740 [Draconibacterium sediminis]